MTLTGNGGDAHVNTAGYAVSLTGLLSGPGGLTKTGAGPLTLTAVNDYAGTTTVAGGTLKLLGTSIATPGAWNPVLNLGGADVQAGTLVFDYAGGTSPAATIQSLLAASYHDGQWDTGMFRCSTAAANDLTLGCVDDPSSSQVRVMATYAGDFNLDGVVDNLDRQIWFANAFTGTTWQQGDANYDGAVNGLDRDLWFAHVGLPPIAGASPAAADVAPVPEPGTLALLATALIALLRYARKRRV